MKKATLITVLLMTFAGVLMAQPEEERYVPETDPLVLQKLSQWQDMKFGLLMHWGPYSQWGVVESWSICAEDEGWCRRSMDDYIAYKKKYEGLKNTFNPVNFNPEKWAKAAKDAGMRYVVFTTKHHDGFCMFDTKTTDYKVTSADCPFHTNPKANIAREIFSAFRQEGLWTGAYFSKPDWHSEYYWWPNFATPDRNVNYDPLAYPDRWEKFVEYTRQQIMELMTDYGKMDILWLDGGWVAKKDENQIRRAYDEMVKNTQSGFLKSRIVNQDIRMDEIVAMAREKQPGLIVVDRAVYGKNQNYLTPENRVPEKTLPYPWESCIISGGGWSFTPNAKYMSQREAIQLLIDIVAKGGNLLLNVAPGPDGDWQKGAYDLLAGIGAWMKVNGNAIYNSKPVAPFKEKNICMTQQKDGITHFYYMAADKENSMPAAIHITSHQPAKGAKVHLLGSKTSLNWKNEGQGFVINLPESLRKNPPCNFAWVFEVSKLKN